MRDADTALQPVAPPSLYDLGRLELIRDQHRDLMDRYRQAGERHRTAAEEVVRARGALSTDPRSQHVLRMPVADLSKLSLQQLADAHVDPRAVQRLVALESRAVRLRAERDALEGRATRSIAYMERVEAFARKNHL